MSRVAVVITVSTRAADGTYPDRSGPIIVQALREWGFRVADPVVVPDGPPVGEALSAALADRPAVVITTGGTGINPTDRTPEHTRAVLDLELPHLAGQICSYGVGHGVPTAVLSRGLAGVAGRTLVVNLPGSTGGVRDGLAVLAPVVPHAVDQLAGADHPTLVEPVETTPPVELVETTPPVEPVETPPAETPPAETRDD